MSTKGEPREPNWTESELGFLRENYIRIPIADIAVQLGRSYEAVRRKAAKVGAQRQEWGEPFTAEEEDLLREKYAALPMSEMVALLRRHPNSIRQRASALGLVNMEQVKRTAMASGVRHDYFSQIDSPTKAYLLGLLATDGTVNSASNAITLKISIKDIELVELLRDEISPRSMVHTYTMAPLPGYTKERQVANITVCSAQLKADLGYLGVVPRKTFTLQWPDLQPQFTAPFLLGCLDGDGMLHLDARPGCWQWSLYSASAPFLAAAQAAIRQHIGLDLRRCTSKRGLHELRLTGGRRIQVLDAWLHADVAGLSRKRLPEGAYARALQEKHVRLSEAARKRALSAMPAIRRPRFSLEARDRAQRLRIQGLSLTQIATDLGVSRSTIYRWTQDVPAAA
jgi:Homeodomain-like domain